MSGSTLPHKTNTEGERGGLGGTGTSGFIITKQNVRITEDHCDNKLIEDNIRASSCSSWFRHLSGMQSPAA